MTKKDFTIVFCFVAVVMALIPVWRNRQGKLNVSHHQLGFPYEIKDEKRHEVMSHVMWTARVVLPSEYYSKENLDVLFRFYSSKHPDKKDRLHMRVYADDWDVERETDQPYDISIPVTPKEETTSPRSELDSLGCDAFFSRQGDGAATGGGNNEWYIYYQNLEKKDETKTVILKGKDPFAVKNIIDSWDTSDKTIKLNVTAYELKNVEPPGIYYTFESIKGSTLWREIMTYRHKEQVPIPRNQVRFVNDKIAYVFMGWLFAVTVDSGYSWSVWDASEILPDWHCCNFDLIEDIKIAPDGTGTMFIGSIPGQQRGGSKLVTDDYGRHWTSK